MNLGVENKQYFFLFTFGLLVNVCAFVMQRLIGFEYILHDDTQEYIALAKEVLDTASYDVSFIIYDYFELNRLFQFLTYVSLRLFDSLYPLTLFNIVLGSFLPIALIRLALTVGIELNNRHTILLGMTLSLLPYTTHLSVNLLKEVLFIVLSIEFLIRVSRKEYATALLFLILLLWTRNSLAYFIPMAYIAVGLYMMKPNVINTVLYGVVGVSIILNTRIMDIFERSANLSLGGREFFSNLPLVRVTNAPDLILSFITSPLKNIFLPNIFTVQNMTEFMYVTHATLFQIIFFIFFAFAIKNKITWSKGVITLLLFSMLCMWFIDVVLPNWGANMRYREVFLLILETMMLGSILQSVERQKYPNSQRNKGFYEQKK